MNTKAVEMPVIDALKAEIAFWEKLFFASLAMTAAVTGWIVSEHNKSDYLITLGAGLIVAGSIFFCVWAYRKIYQLIGALKNV